ncbi:MAG: HlyC/CorC family transporter [Aeriscardovia sp.]|nr:HlyC/CorC family transporter [Aeriscardovia sp.]
MQSIFLISILSVLMLFFIVLSLIFAGQEAAVTRVTRTSLNNRSLDTQTDEDLTQFEKSKRLKKISQVQVLIVDRNATAASASFFRITMNVLTGVIGVLIAIQLSSCWWISAAAGILSAIIIGILSIFFRPRVAGTSRPLDMMIRHTRLMRCAVWLTPFAKISGLDKSFREDGDGNLSDDEEIEKIHNEQNRAMIDRIVEATDLDEDVADMLHNVVTLSDTLTREIMVPRTDMVCINKNETLGECIKIFSRSGFSRMPVIGDDIDDLIGVAYLKDAVQATAFNPQARGRRVQTIVRDPLLVPELKAVDDLFHQMQQERQHIAVVVDEYGGIAGLVTIEDAIEQIVGELADEHDKTQHVDPVQIDGSTWRVPARTPISDLEEIFEINIDEDDVDTVYGLLTKLLGHVPTVGEKGKTHGLMLTAMDSAGCRKKVSMILVKSVQSFDMHGDEVVRGV